MCRSITCQTTFLWLIICSCGVLWLHVIFLSFHWVWKVFITYSRVTVEDFTRYKAPATGPHGRRGRISKFQVSVRTVGLFKKKARRHVDRCPQIPYGYVLYQNSKELVTVQIQVFIIFLKNEVCTLLMLIQMGHFSIASCWEMQFTFLIIYAFDCCSFF